MRVGAKGVEHRIGGGQLPFVPITLRQLSHEKLQPRPFQ